LNGAHDEAEVWADGYGFVEFQRTGTGFIPYHYELGASLAPAAQEAVSAEGKSQHSEMPSSFLA
jgi:hypothetical protein